jgi:hypothetical protein
MTINTNNAISRREENPGTFQAMRQRVNKSGAETGCKEKNFNCKIKQ